MRVLLGLCSLFVSASLWSQDAAFAWLELTPTGASARAIVTQGACPQAVIDGEAKAMTPRAPAAPGGFSGVTACECAVPVDAQSVTIGGQALPMPKREPRRIVVVGDTGCRMKGGDFQNCNGKGKGPPWIFDRIAAAAAAVKPDLVIHVGDYLYREAECDASVQPGCEGSPYGYNWPTWRTDFFDPAAELLAAAPWIFVRGNHENCERAWRGYFYFLDPRPLSPGVWDACPDHPEPYAIAVGRGKVVVLDSSRIEGDFNPTPEPAMVAIFTEQLQKVNQLVGAGSAWVATHRPIWAISPFLDHGAISASDVDITLQTALAKTEAGAFAAGVSLLLAGHIHNFEMIRPSDGRPSLAVVGSSGTELSPPLAAYLAQHPELLSNLKLAPDQFEAVRQTSFLVLEAEGSTWRATLRDAAGQALKRYSLAP